MKVIFDTTMADPKDRNVSNRLFSFMSREAQEGKPYDYNKQPIPIYNPFAVAFAYSDNALQTERVRVFCFQGALTGLGPAFYSYALSSRAAKEGFTLIGRGGYFGKAAFFGAMGAFSALSYLGGVNLASQYRGDTDDMYNHFIGGYFMTLPTSIYLGSIRTFLTVGTHVGLICAIGKYLYSNGYTFVNFNGDWSRTNQPRYPEIYVRSVYKEVGDQEAIQKAREYQNKG